MLKKLALLTSLLTCISLEASALTDRTGHAYFEAAGGYALQKARSDVSGSSYTKKNAESYVINLGYGYTFTNLMRADIMLHYDDGKASKSGVKNEIKSVGGMLNGYIDFKNSTEYTPYIVGGVGYFTNKMKSQDTNPGDGTYNYSKPTHNMGYKVGIGTLMEVDSMVDFDFAYNYIHKNAVHISFENSKSEAGEAKFKCMHAFMFGIKLNY